MLDKNDTADAAPSGRRRHLLLIAVVVAVTSFVLAPVRENGFINRDDPDYVTDNMLIRDLSIPGIGEIFSTPQVMGNYHPLTLVLLGIEYRFFGDAAGSYHLVSLLLHLLAAVLVYYLAKALSGSDLVAFGTGLLWGVHPLHVESIAWASEQKDLLFALFYLAGLLVYLRYLRGGLRPSLYAAAMLLFVLSLLSKATAASFPVALWLVDAFHQRHLHRRALWEKLPFVALALAFGFLAIHAQALSGAIVEAAHAPFFSRLGVALIALPRYLLKLVFPADLSAFYPYPDFASSGFTLEIIAALLLLGVLAYCGYRSGGRQPLVWFGLAFFIATVALVLQIIPVGGAMMADRYMYLPSFGILLGAVGAAESWSTRLRNGTTIVLAGIIVCTAALTVGTQHRVGVWRDNVTLWSDLIERSPELSFPYVYRANARTLPAERELAFRDFDRALAIDSTLGFGYYSRGYALAWLGEHEAAVADYTQALKFGYDPPQTLSGRGGSWTALGRYDEAIADFSRAIAMKPTQLDAYFNRANVYAARKEYRQAIADYNIVLARNPRDAETQAHRGLARLLTGDRGGCDDLRSAAAAGITKAADALSALCR